MIKTINSAVDGQGLKKGSVIQALFKKQLLSNNLVKDPVLDHPNYLLLQHLHDLHSCGKLRWSHVLGSWSCGSIVYRLSLV